MVASDLKVYRDTFELIVNLIEFQTYFSKMFKYTLGGRIQEDAYPLFRFIQSANMCVGENRVNYPWAKDSWASGFAEERPFKRLALTSSPPV